MPSPPNAKRSTNSKHVRWSTVTIYEFGVGFGGSAVPKRGPSIGLGHEPEFTWSTAIGKMARANDGVQRFTTAERIKLLQKAGYKRDDIDTFVQEATNIRKSRKLYNSEAMKLLRKKRHELKAEIKQNQEETIHVYKTEVNCPSISTTNETLSSERINCRTSDQIIAKVHPIHDEISRVVVSSTT